MTSQIWRMRLIRACAILLGLALFVLVVDELVFVKDAQAATAATQAGIDARAIIGDGDPEEFLRRMQQAVAVEGGALPEPFSSEAELPAGYRDVRVDSTGTIISCVVDRNASDVAGEVSERMALRGWREVSLGAVEGATYTKEVGACAWTLVTCTQVGDASAVVYRCVYR